MLAPVLARLSEVPGILDVRVECSGTHFLLRVRDEAAFEAAWPRVRELLGARAERLSPEAHAAQVDARPRGEPWFSKDDIRALSFVEGRILATRFTDAVASATTLDPETRHQVTEAIRLEIFAALEYAHDTGGRASSGWFWEEWPSIVNAISGRLDALPAITRAAIVDALRAADEG